jgi:glycosyltransferase involved in cell wall biosynthesis
LPCNDHRHNYGLTRTGGKLETHTLKIEIFWNLDTLLVSVACFSEPDDRLYRFKLTKKNGGKGSAIREGLAKATGTFTVIQDADAEYDPSEIMRLLARAKELPGTIVFGSRFLTKNPNLYKRYLLGNKALTGFINLLFGVHLTDSYTCYKLFPTALMQSLPLRANGFELEAELTCLPLCKRHTIVEVPITYKPRSLEEGKKIRFKDAVKGVMRTIGIRITGR